MNHTPEPWRIGTLDDTLVLQGTEVIVASTQQDGEPFTDENKANARRIVACVNACRGISDECFGDSEWETMLTSRAKLEALRADNARLMKELKENLQVMEFIDKLSAGSWTSLPPRIRKIKRVLKNTAALSSEAPEAKGESGEAELLVPCALLDALNKALEVTFWTSDDGTATRGGIPEDDDIPDYVAKPWRNLRALLARKPVEERGPEVGDDKDDVLAVSFDLDKPASKWSVMRRREIKRYKGQHIVVLMHRVEVEARVKEAGK